MEADLSQHPERSVEARPCVLFMLFGVLGCKPTLLIGLMGRVAATINDIKTAQEM